jgi:hypothetical protein
VARKHIKDPELLAFIDIECYCWSTVLAADTPMINAGMVRMRMHTRLKRHRVYAKLHRNRVHAAC